MDSRKRLNVGVVGAGYWGPNIIRNFASDYRWNLAWIADVNPAHLAKIGRVYPSARLTDDYREMLRDRTVEAVAVVTPLDVHYEIVCAALQAGKHVLVEKPLTATTEEGRRVCELAERAGTVVMVDHIYLYTGALEQLYRSINDRNTFGRVLYIDSVRVNLGPFRSGADVIYDLAPHDISAINWLLGEYPTTVNAHAVACVYPDHNDVAFLTLRYPSGVLAHVHLNWLSPVKMRKFTVVGSRNMAVWDDVDPAEKVKIYDKGIELANDDESVYQRRVSYRLGDVHAPAIDTTEALTKVISAFYAAIADGIPTRANAQDGLAVVEVLEAAQRSASNNGATIELELPKLPTGV